MALEALVLALGFLVSLLAGLVGLGGGIILAPALLYLPPLLGVGDLDMRSVSGLTITQGLLAGLVGTVQHGRRRFVDRRLVGWMGGAMMIGSLAGSMLSRWVPERVLVSILAGMAMAGAALMASSRRGEEEVPGAEAVSFNAPLAATAAAVAGTLCGMVGQGGSFIIIPLMVHVLRLPLRVAIGSNLAIVLLAALAGFLGKLATGQVPHLPALALLLGAIPGAFLGGLLSRAAGLGLLRRVLAAVILIAAIRLGADVLAGAV